LAHARRAVGATFGIRGVNCVGIMPVPRIEVVLCDFSSVHRSFLRGELDQYLGVAQDFPGAVVGIIAPLVLFDSTNL
jgi:hypothetical protein